MLLFSNQRGAKWWTALTIVACGLLLLSNTIYFSGGPPPRFLLEKGNWARNPCVAGGILLSCRRCFGLPGGWNPTHVS